MIKAVIFDMYETLITLFESSHYFGTQMAADIGVSEKQFRELWRPTEYDRTIGKITLEEAIKCILNKFNCYSDELLHSMINKRIKSKEEVFEHMNTEIIPMLEALKKKGIQIGLISNCFSEEAYVIKKSVLYPYFDAVCLSYDEGIQKPDIEIFDRCIERLNVKAEECLYVGDGGSMELETARSIGMKAVQAVWYLKDGTTQPTTRKADFKHMEKPMDVLNELS